MLINPSGLMFDEITASNLLKVDMDGNLIEPSEYEPINAGVVIHGAIRDGHEIDGMDIGVKALGTVPKRGERTGAGERDVAVSFGGVTFIPGRRLVADDDGVIVLPEGVTEADIRIDDVVAATAAYAAGPSK
jgi:regulator of ribonuclease activity A